MDDRLQPGLETNSWWIPVSERDGISARDRFAQRPASVCIDQPPVVNVVRDRLDDLGSRAPAAEHAEGILYPWYLSVAELSQAEP